MICLMLQTERLFYNPRLDSVTMNMLELVIVDTEVLVGVQAIYKKEIYND